MSFDELNTFFEATELREKDKLKTDIIVAFINAQFQRKEKISGRDLTKILNQIDGKKTMDTDEMIAKAKQLNAMFGGKVKKGGE